MSNNDAEQFQLRENNARAEGEITTKGFIVRAGTIVKKAIASSATDVVTPIRTRLLSEGVLVNGDKGLRFSKDYIFDSPSGAAATVLGRAANGWKEWKLADGRTLSEVKHVARPDGEATRSNSSPRSIST